MEKELQKLKKVQRPKLTKKRKGFVKDFVMTGDRKEAVMKNFDTTNPKTAHSIAAELLEIPEVQEAIVTETESFKQILDKHLPEDKVVQKHKELLDSVILEKLSFDERDSDDEIRLVIEKMPGYELLYIKEGLNADGDVISKYAYVKAPNGTIQEKALDKAYKLRGRYLDEPNPVKTPTNVTYNFLFSDETQKRIKIINEEIKAKLIHVEPD